MASKVFLTLSCWAVLMTKARGDSGCSPRRAVSLEVGNITLGNGQIARGVVMGVGTPSQPMAFLPQSPLNNSFVYGTTGFCDAVTSGWSVDGCTTFRGGAYDSTSSSTMEAGAASAFAPDTGSYPDLQQISDTVALQSNFTLDKFPMGIVQADWGEQGYYPQAALGLGPNSTLLSTLVDSGTIASRTWSWYWGLNGPSDSTQMNGNLVLGGYDKAKVSGTGFKQTINTGSGRCDTGLFVTLSDILLHMEEGTEASIFADGGDASTLLAACLDPAYPSLTTIPLDPYFDNFQSLTNASITGRSSGLNWFNMRYDADQTPFDGDVTVQIGSDFSIQVANAQYIMPDVTVDKSTGALESNSTEPDVAMIALQDTNSDDVLRIGRHFFSSAYMMVNYDAGEFTIWSANPTTSENLVAVDATGAELDNLCSSGNNGTATVTAGGTSPSSTGGSTSSGTSASSGPAIAGGVVGAVAGLAALGVFAWWLLRRRINNNKASKTPSATGLTGDHAEQDFGSGPGRASIKSSAFASRPDTAHELATESLSMSELPSSGDGDRRGEPPRYELGDGTVIHEM